MMTEEVSDNEGFGASELYSKVWIRRPFFVFVCTYIY